MPAPENVPVTSIVLLDTLLHTPTKLTKELQLNACIVKLLANVNLKLVGTVPESDGSKFMVNDVAVPYVDGVKEYVRDWNDVAMLVVKDGLVIVYEYVKDC